MELFMVVAVILVAVNMKLPKMLLHNLHRVVYYTVQDSVLYFREHKWEAFPYYGIDMFVAMFGKGKTLSMTHRALKIYRQYGDQVCFYSNYHLEDIPYIPLKNFNQLVDLGAENGEGQEYAEYAGYVVLLDEISSVLSHRNFSSFPLELLSMLCQQRKRKIYIMCSAQRFFMVDKIWRGITTRGVICNKLWRLVHNVYFDAWEYENATTASVLQRLGHIWWFCRDSDYHAYDTSEMITRAAAADFISNEEAIVRKGLDSQPMFNDVGLHLNKKARKRRDSRA